MRMRVAAVVLSLLAACCACGVDDEPAAEDPFACAAADPAAIEVASQWRGVFHACQYEETIVLVNDSPVVLAVTASNGVTATLGTPPESRLAAEVYAMSVPPPALAGTQVYPGATATASQAGDAQHVMVSVDGMASAQWYLTSVVARWAESKVTAQQIGVARSVQGCVSALRTAWTAGEGGVSVAGILLDTTVVIRSCPALFEEVNTQMPKPSVVWASELKDFTKSVPSTVVDDLIAFARRAIS